MTFGDEYLTHLRVIQNIGMARIDPVTYQGIKIVPLQFLKAVLPDPGELGENYEGETSIGCRIRGLKAGIEQTYYIWNNCSHQAALSGNWGPGSFLHHGSSGNDRSYHDAHQTMARSGRF